MAETVEQAPEQALIESVCDRERVAIIFNPVSGTEDSATRRSDLEELARAAGLTCELVETDVDRGAAPLAEQAVVDGMERVIVSGGDGSMTEAAHALTGTQSSLAVVPGGTANLLALNLGIPTDREAAMRLALSGEARPTDIARVNGVVCLITAGIGLDARVMRDADRQLKDRFGIFAYVIAAWRNLGRRHASFTITVDGRKLRSYGQTVLIANMGRINGGLELVPGADPDDGLIEVAVLRTRRLRDVALVAVRALLGLHRGDDLLRIYRGRNIVVETPLPQPVQVDGDPLDPTTRLEAHVEPGALLLVRPAEVELPSPVVELVTAPVRHTWPRLAIVAAALALGLWVLRRRRS
jgi:YegS/Rv2252/BmrU family lipid kinase